MRDRELSGPPPPCPSILTSRRDGRLIPVATLVSLLRRFAHELVRYADVRSIVPRGSSRFRLAAVWALLSLKQRIAPSSRARFRVRWSGPAGEVSAVVGDTSELRVIREMFVLQEYALPDDVQPRVIVDLGSNAGISVLFFKARYPEASVVAVEPVPHVFDRLSANTGHLPGVSLINAAVSDRDGELTLYTGAKSWTASATPDALRTQACTVQALTLESILIRTGVERVDVLKLDVEGAEIPVLSSSAAARDADVIVFEFHREHSQGTVWELLERLPGFEVVRIRDDSEVHPLVTLRRIGSEQSSRRGALRFASATRQAPSGAPRASA
jgi:FkbM family methyltransferase